MTISSQEIPLAAWSLFLCQRQEFLNNHPNTPNQQGAHEMRQEVLSMVGAQDMDTSVYQVLANLDGVEIYWGNGQLVVDTIVDRALILPFNQQHKTTWRW